jgi:DNA-binding NarL/FixJ family response regulator
MLSHAMAEAEGAVTTPMKCLIVDDHPVVRQGIRSLLEKELRGVEITDAPTAQAAVDYNDDQMPDVAIVDPRGAGGEVEEVVGLLRKRLRCAIVVFTSNGGARLLAEALKAGVKGYVRKDSPPEDLVRAIRAAQEGNFYVDPALSSTIVLEEGDRTLTVRQREILQMLADGMQTEAVARKLGLSTETVRTHTKRILAKLHADTRTQAVAIAIRNGLIE